MPSTEVSMLANKPRPWPRLVWSGNTTLYHKGWLWVSVASSLPSVQQERMKRWHFWTQIIIKCYQNKRNPKACLLLFTWQRSSPSECHTRESVDWQWQGFVQIPAEGQLSLVIHIERGADAASWVQARRNVHSAKQWHHTVVQFHLALGEYCVKNFATQKSCLKTSVYVLRASLPRHTDSIRCSIVLILHCPDANVLGSDFLWSKQKSFRNLNSLIHLQCYSTVVNNITSDNSSDNDFKTIYIPK